MGGPKRIAEVIETSSDSFTSQCYTFDGALPLGSFVSVGNPSTYAVISNIMSGPLDPGRRVIARGSHEESEDSLFLNHPQLEHLLITRMEAVIIGYDGGDKIYHGLPPLPPRLHSFVYTCETNTIEALTEQFDFLQLLTSTQATTRDEAVASCLRQASLAHPQPREFLLAAGRALAQDLSEDLRRLNALIWRITR